MTSTEIVRPRFAALVLLAVSSLACSTTSFQSTWKAPNAQPLQMRGHKVLAVFISRNESVRRRAEDTLAREITAGGAEGVPSYTFLTQAEAKDPEIAQKKLQNRGLAGTVVMRVVGRDTEYTYQPGLVIWAGPHYRHFWGGYWGWGWGKVWNPGTVRADRVVSVETLVYSSAEDELVWAGVSKTVNPNKVEGLVTELAAAVSKKLEEAHLLTPSSN